MQNGRDAETQRRNAAKTVRLRGRLGGRSGRWWPLASKQRPAGLRRIPNCEEQLTESVINGRIARLVDPLCPILPQLLPKSDDVGAGAGARVAV